MRINFAVLIFLCLAVSFRSHAQSPVIDSLNKIIQQNSNDVREISALNRLAQEYARTDLNRAKSYWYRSIALAEQLKNDTLRGLCYSLMVSAQWNTGQKDSAIYFLNRLHDLSIRSPNILIRDDYNFTAGLFYKLQGNFNAALPFMQASLKAYQERDKIKHNAETRSGLAGQYLNIGNLYINLAQYRLALQAHLKALSLFEEVNNKKGLSFCYQSISSDFIQLKQYRQAFPYLQQALALKKELNDKRGMSTAYAQLGIMFVGLTQYDSALARDEEALKIMQEMKLTAEQEKLFFDMGKVYELKQNPSNAELYWKKSRELAVQLGDSARLAALDAELITLRTSMDRNSKEEKQLVNSLGTSIRTGDRNSELQNYRFLADHYSGNKQFDKAIFYLKKSYALNDSMQNNDLQMQIQKLEEEYNVDKKEKEISLLKKDRQLSQLTLQKNKTFQIGAIISLLLLALTGFLIFNRYRIISKTRRLIELEKMRSHIARDLHDDIGSTLTSIHIISKVSLQEKANGNFDMGANMKKIKERTTAMLESMGDIVWTINPQNDTMSQLIVRMKEFAAEILEPLNIRYVFKEEGDVSAVQMDIQQRKDFYLLFKEAINNAAKHSFCQMLSIHLIREQNNLQLNIEDDGKGFDENEIKPGNGLGNMRARALAMKADLQVRSVKGKSTIISVAMPITV